jgi:Fe-S cluster assembly protein SufD
MITAEPNWLEPLAQSDPAAAAALDALRAQGLPSGRDEHWSHAQLRSLSAVRHLAAITAHAASAAAGAAASLLPPALPGVPRLVLVDGHPQVALSDAPALAAVDFATGGLPLEFADRDLRFGALAVLLSAAALRLQPGAADSTIEILHLYTGRPGSVYPCLSLQLPANARLTLIERHCGGTDAQSLLCTAIDIAIGPGARLELHRLHEFAPGTLLLDQLQLRLAAAAECQVHQLSAGGANIRQSLDARLAGRGASLRWLGAAVQKDGEHHDSLVRIRHEAGDSHAEHRFRALAADRAHVSCSADVLVAGSARGTRVRQSLRGLIDGRGAHINLRPRLEINTDDIQASHGATTGQLDEQLLFYLLARGIDADTARAMLKWAFLEDVLGAVRDPALRRAAEELAARHLGDTATHQLVGSLLA